MSHLGRPDGRVQSKLTLKPVADKLSELLGKYEPLNRSVEVNSSRFNCNALNLTGSLSAPLALVFLVSISPSYPPYVVICANLLLLLVITPK